MKNAIADRVADFLKKFPPFNMLEHDNLTEIAKEVDIVYLEKGDTIFKKDTPFNNHFYIVRAGAVNLHHNNNEQNNIVGINDVGDIFGIRPLIIQENYKLAAIANEESIVYAIPIKRFKKVSSTNVKIHKYLITAFASNTYDPYTAEENGKIFVDYLPNTSLDIANFQSANYTKAPITCYENSTLKDAAIKMQEHKIGCIVVVNRDKHPVGMVTNSDIKNKIATGQFPIKTSVTNIMSSPIITDKKDITVAHAQLQMIQHNIGHLCITKDGTANTRLIGILTHHDILVTLGNTPSVILKEIKRAKKNKTLRSARIKANTLLKSYLEQNMPLSHIVKVISKINEAVSVRAIELAIKKMKSPPPTNFAWLSIGYCEADMMASNPEWCKSLSEWQEQFKNWIFNPNEKAILLSSVFFDYSHVYGDKHLTEQLTNTIYQSIANTSLFFKTLGKDALKNPPPLGFFKQFLVEQNGDKKNLFNIKSKALMPLIDAGRLLALSKQIKEVNNTYERFEKLSALEPNNKELFDSCAYAYKALLKFRTKQGLQNENSGKFIELATLTKEEKLKLKRCFKPINEIQESLKLRFDLKI